MRDKPNTTHYARLIDFDCLIKIPGHFRLLYKRLDIDLKELETACRTIKFTSGTRAAGLKTVSKPFGYKPRVAIRDNVCSMAQMAVDYPWQHKVFMDFGRVVSREFRNSMPIEYKIHTSLVNAKPILSDYMIEGTPFSSGIVNYNNSMNYHLDRGNVPMALSCMVVLKRDVSGGILSLPELEIGIETDHSTLLVFAGQQLLHGVTPIEKESESGFRFSMVYYCMDRMWQCLPPEEDSNLYESKLDKQNHYAKKNRH